MNTKRLIAKISALLLVGVTLVVPGVASAAQPLTARSATVDNSAGNASGVSYTVRFTLGTNNENLGAVLFEICDSPVNTSSCVGTGDSSGASFGSATFGSVTGLAGAWSANAGTAGGAGGTSILFKKAVAGAETGQPSATMVINNVTNPTAVNKEYYLRVSTYTNVTGTAPSYPGTDYGAVAMATTQSVTVSGTMPESLVFCVGTTGSNCSNINGSSVDLGTFSPVGTSTGTSVMSASTNAGAGYIITINGTTMTSGINSITAMGTQSANSAGCSPSCTSAIGTSQFGSNVRANNVATATPTNFGADVSGAGTATGSGGYNTANSFRFFTGDTVAGVGGVSDDNFFTNSYIVNVGGSQAAGLYTSTMTYICTATF